MICARSKQCASSGRKAQAGRRTPANPNSAPEGASGKGKARAGWRGRSRRARLRVERRALQVDLVRDLVALVDEVQAGRHGGVALELERAHLGHGLDQVLHALVDRALVQDHAQALEDPARARARLNLQPPSNACAGSAAAGCGGASAHAWRGHLAGMKRRAGPSRNGQKDMREQQASAGLPVVRALARGLGAHWCGAMLTLSRSSAPTSVTKPMAISTLSSARAPGKLRSRRSARDARCNP